MASDGKVVIDVLLDDEQVEKGIANIESDFDKLGSKGAKAFKGLGTAIKGVGVAAGAMMGAGVAAITGLVESTAELNGDLARLRTNAVDAGFGVAQVEDAFKRVAAVSGEADSAVETVSNLLATNIDEGQLPEYIDLINGAAIRFSDTLKTEGIADGLQETFATGEAIGPFAELLERSGVNLDTFNAGLAKAAKTGSETDYVLQQMSQLGLGSVYEEYQKTNPELVAYNEASVNLQTALAGLGQTFMPLVTASKEFAITLIDLVQGNTTLGEVVDGLVQKFAGLVEQFTGIDASVVVNAFEQIKTVVSTVVEAITEYFNQGLSNLQSAWQTHGETILATVQSAFDFVVAYIQEAINVIVPFVQEQLAKVKQFWSENGTQIVEAVTNFLQGAKAVFDFVLPAILAVVEYIWNAIKNVITGALDIIMGVVKIFSGLFTGDFSKMWEGVKQLFSGAIDLIMGLMSLSFVGGIRTLVTNLAKTFINVIKTKWTTVVGLFKNSVNTVSSTISSWVGKVLGFVKNLATSFTNAVTTLRTKVVTRFKELSTQVINAVKDLPGKMLQIGKDIVGGLIKGIKDAPGKVVNAVKGVADSVLNAFTSRTAGFDTHSPSKKTTEIGKFVGQGLVKGMESTKKENEKAANDLTKVILNVTKKNSAEVSKIAAEAEKERTKIQKDHATKRGNLKKADAKKIRELESDMHAKLKEVNDKAWAEMVKKEAELSKERLEAVQQFIENKKKLNELSLIDEAEYWRTAYKQFKNGSEENVALRQSYRENVNRINDAITSKNAEYLSKAQKINDDLIKGEQDLNQKYNDALESRYQTILGYYGLFDAVTKQDPVSKLDLTLNLRDQVMSLQDWAIQLEALRKRNLSAGLVDELESMGPKATEQLRALNSMTDKELKNYLNLYQQKSRIARESAIKELEPLKQETKANIQALRDAANVELTQLNTDWQKAIKDVIGGTEKQFKTLHQVGKNAGQGLLDGLSSMQPALAKKAKAIAETVKSTIQKALDIHSPSRWMRDFVAGNMAKGFTIGVDKNESSLLKAAAQMGEYLKPDLNIVNPLRNAKLNLGLDKPSTSTSNISNVYNYGQTQADPPQIAIQPAPILLDGRKIADVTFEAVSVNQGNNLAIRSMVKGVR